MPQLIVPHLSMPFIEGTFRSLGDQLKAHLAAALSYWWSIIDLVEAYHLIHRSISLPFWRKVADMGNTLQHMLARVNRLNPGDFVEQGPGLGPGLYSPPPQRRQQIFGLINCVETVLLHLTELEDLKKRIFVGLNGEQGVDVAYAPDPCVRGATFTNIVVALSLSRDNLQYELDPFWLWDSEPSTPSNEDNHIEAASFLVNMLLEEVTDGVEPRPHSARIAANEHEANARAIQAANRNYARSHHRRRHM